VTDPVDLAWQPLGHTDSDGLTYERAPTVTVELTDHFAALTDGVLVQGGVQFDRPGGRVWISRAALGLPDDGAAERRERSEPPNV
jgi:hypothetical protein